MDSLPAALAGLADYPQFLLYRATPGVGARAGKIEKTPIDWRTGRTHDPNDPAAWTTADNALLQVASGRADGIGFAFTDNDPFFFVDIDHALQHDGTWSPLAQWLCAAFPGAAVEVSVSGRGLHIVGSGVCPPHSCEYDKDDDEVQFFTRARFVALTGTNAVGDVRADMSAVLPWLVEHYFPPRTTVTPAQWDAGPREDWRGPTDDDDLVRRAMRSSSAAAAFGNRASFADLWTGDEAALARAFPSQTDIYNRSRADSALASHLAFWTGNDGPRIERLMRASALARDKWDDRVDYLVERTIGGVLAMPRDVCKDAEVAAPEVTAPADVVLDDLPIAKPRETKKYLAVADQPEFFRGCVYVQDRHRIMTPNGAMLNQGQFRATYGGHTFLLDDGNEKVTRDAWEAFTESTSLAFPRAGSSWFRPDYPAGGLATHEGVVFVNTYLPLTVRRVKGDVSPVLEHLARILPVERDRSILLAYMAACVQYPGVKFQWAPLLQGVEGNGKSLYSRCVAYAVGERYTHWPRADQISSQFNSWLYGKLFIAVEDVYLPEDRGEVFEILKPMITNDRQPVEPKGVDQFSAYVWCNLMLNCNRKEGLRKTRNDRRIAPFYTAQQSKEDLARDHMGGRYFPNLYEWLKRDGFAIMAEYLSTYDIPDEFNPAGDCQIAPLTSSTESAIAESLGGVEQEIMEAIESRQPGFCAPWVSSVMLDRLLIKLNKANRITRRKREKMMEDLGYVKHPALPDGRVHNVILPDGQRPVLFVKAGSPEAALATAAGATKAYTDANLTA